MAVLGGAGFLGLVPPGRPGPAVVRRVPAAVRPARPAPAAGAVTGRWPLVVRAERRGIIVVQSPGGDYQYVFLCFFWSYSAVVAAGFLA